jgi:hypothetical protein
MLLSTLYPVTLPYACEAILREVPYTAFPFLKDSAHYETGHFRLSLANPTKLNCPFEKLPMKNFLISGAFVALTLAPQQAQATCNKSGTYVAASGDVVETPRCKGFGEEGAHYRCRDSSFSHAEHPQGACSRHGGIAEALD